MKRLLTYFLMATLLIVVGCSKYDDSELTGRVDNLENRVTALEELCKQMNTNITSLQTIVNALQNNDYVTSVTPIMQDGVEIGYTITFAKSDSITIYHGKNGSNGEDGYTPVIGVEKDTDGIYYWTIDGEWLTDDKGNKIKAQGIDGKDGQSGTNGEDGTDGDDGADGSDGMNGKNGKDGITPKLKIENDYWYVSYDNGKSWEQLGKATGANGTNGSNGDSFFQNIDISDDDFVVFTLSDGTEIKLPTWYAFEALHTLCNQMNTNISSLQSIVTAIQNNDYVTGVTPITENGKEVGYTITFSKSGPVTIYHGKDGANGTNGSNGTNGHTPVIGVALDNGVYYWTVDGEWLTDADGNKIKAEGKDGANGTNGTNGSNGSNGENGVTPKLKIEDDYWYVSYDEGKTWTKLDKAVGEDGVNGENGDSMFSSVTQDEDNVYLNLSGGTTITLSKGNTIMTQIKDITFIPEYSDGGASVYYTAISNKANSYAVFDFIISPKSVATKLATDDKWKSMVSMSAVYTKTRSNSSSVNLPITKFEVDETSGVATVTVSCAALSEAFFRETTAANAVMCISDETTSIYSEYVPLVETIVYPDAKQIYYTTTDGNPINYTSSNLYSNVYENGVGIITFKNNVTEIYDRSFSDCATLKSVTIPEGVISIEGFAFYGCSNLEEVIIPNTVSAISSSVFEGCSSLVTIDIPTSVTLIGNNAFAKCSSLKEIVLPNGIKEINNRIFKDCVSLQKIGMPNNLITIEEYAFSGCIKLESIIIPSTTMSIERFAFEKCESLTNIIIPSGVTSINMGLFYKCSKLENISIHNAINMIGEQAFEGCSSLKSFIIPVGMSTISNYTFSGCSSLESVIIPNTITEIGKCAFQGCTLLNDIAIPRGVTMIDSKTFLNCVSLTGITIPDAVTSIGDEAFYECI